MVIKDKAFAIFFDKSASYSAAVCAACPAYIKKQCDFKCCELRTVPEEAGQNPMMFGVARPKAVGLAGAN
jgi:hypothetical protein